MKLLRTEDIQSLELRELQMFNDCQPISLMARPGQAIQLSGDPERITHVLRCIGGLEEPHSGGIYINDRLMGDFSFEEFAPLRLNIGYFFPMGGLMGSRSLYENLMTPFIHHQANFSSSEKVVIDTLTELGIIKYRDVRPFAMPGIARKLGCVARVIALNPQLLLLEHLFEGISPTVKRTLGSWICNKIEKGGIVFLRDRDFAETQLKPSNSLDLISQELAA